MSGAERRDTGDVAIEAAEKTFPGSKPGKPWKLAGGAVHDSWAIDTVTPDGVTHELVVRVTPAGRVDYEKTQREAEVLRIAYERGVRCPKPFGTGLCATGEDYVVMNRVRGDTNPRLLLTTPEYAEARRLIIPQLAEDLAIVHSITPAEAATAPGMRGPTTGEDPLSYACMTTEMAYRADLLNPHPGIEWAFRWLRREVEALKEEGREPCLVHGDFRIGNLMFDEGGVTALIDWEGTHIGEPEEDLTWFLTRVWRFSQPQLEAGGIVHREEWVRAYEVASGRPVDRRRVAAWEVLQNIRWCQITMMQARAHLDGKTVSHELAAIGRRFGETELEVLRLTGLVERVRNAG
ncbi:MAG: phosphotransferase family protein [Dehalococcoidia bacterium]|nr:phosphotransferase family protein [Dehalococcoidia bacterium]